MPKASLAVDDKTASNHTFPKIQIIDADSEESIVISTGDETKGRSKQPTSTDSGALSEKWIILACVVTIFVGITLIASARLLVTHWSLGLVNTMYVIGWLMLAATIIPACRHFKESRGETYGRH